MEWLTWIVVVSAVLGAHSGCQRTRAQHNPKNLLIILVDTLRQDHLGAYGYPRPISPVMDRMAKEGVRADGLTPTSWTKPATATLLTGLHPLRHQAIDRDDLLSEAVSTLAERLSARGYSTLAVSGNAYVSPEFGLDQGFATFMLVQREPGPGGSLILRLRYLLEAHDLRNAIFAEIGALLDE